MNGALFKVFKLMKMSPGYLFDMPLEQGGELLVNVGDKLEVGGKLYKASVKKIKESHYLPKELDVMPDKSSDYLCRLEGEYVGAGETIAEKLSTAGLVTSKALTNTDGIISTNRIKMGYVDILGEAREEVFESEIKGRIKAITLGSSIQIECNSVSTRAFDMSNFDKSEFDLGHNIVGKLKVLGDGTSVYLKKDLKDDYQGSIVFAGRFLYSDLAVELVEKGCKCVVAYSMEYSDFINLTVPVIIFGGFGNLTFHNFWLDFIRMIKDTVTSIDLENKLVTFCDNGKFSKLKEAQKTQSFWRPVLEEGMIVKCMDIEHFGFIGKIVAFPDEDHALLTSEENSHLLILKNALEVIS